MIENLGEYKKLKDPSCCKRLINTVNKTDKRLSDLPQLVKYWFIQINDKINKSIKQIYVSLPYDLMNHPIEDWEFDELIDNTIGEYYEVLIRCSKRLKGNDPAIRKWERKWEKIENKLAKSATETFFPCNCSEVGILESYSIRDDVLAVTITTVFQQEQPGKVLWKSGIPIGLWIREQLADTDNKEVLKQLIKNDCSEEASILVRGIPEAVKNKRIESISQQRNRDHVGRHLCLLWDDPNLRPPEQYVKKINNL